MIPIIGIVGSQSNVGKTMVMEQLIRILKQRHYRVATIKHDVHGFEMDQPGKDTYKHAQAGADMVIISSPNKLAMIEKVEEERTLDEVVGYIRDVDIIIVEGYKNSSIPKIEVYRSDRCTTLYSKLEYLVAVISDIELDIEGIPVYLMHQLDEVADYIENNLIGNNK